MRSSECQICGKDIPLVKHHIIPKTTVTCYVFGLRIEHQVNIAYICPDCNLGFARIATNKILNTRELQEEYVEITDVDLTYRERKPLIDNLFLNLLYKLRKAQSLPKLENLIVSSKDQNFYIILPLEKNIDNLEESLVY